MKILPLSSDTCKTTFLYNIRRTTLSSISLYYIDEIDDKGRIRTKHYRYYLNFPIVNHLYITTFQQYLHMDYILYIPQLIRNSRACDSNHDFLDRWLLLTKTPLNQGFLLVQLKSSHHRKFCGRHHELANRY